MFADQVPFRRYNLTLGDIPALLKMNPVRFDHIRQLEEYFRCVFPRQYSLFTSSARSALYLYYLTHAGVGGENVITSPLACSVAFAPALAAGLRIRFADVDPESYLLDPDAVMEAIDGRTRFIQVIHLGGNPCDMKPFLDISHDHGIAIVEDCAQSFGATYDGSNVGSFGDAAAFTFTKSLQSISGGALLLKRHQDLDAISKLQNGLGPKSPFWALSKLFQFYLESYNQYAIPRLIYGFFAQLYTKRKASYDPVILPLDLIRASVHRPQPLEAALCIRQLEKYDPGRRARIATAIRSGLKRSGKIAVQKITRSAIPSFDRVMVHTAKPSRDVIRAARSRGIEIKHLSEQYASGVQCPVKNAEGCVNYRGLNDHVLSLPIYDTMGRDAIENLCSTLAEISDN